MSAAIGMRLLGSADAPAFTFVDEVRIGDLHDRQTRTHQHSSLQTHLKTTVTIILPICDLGIRHELISSMAWMLVPQAGTTQRH